MELKKAIEDYVSSLGLSGISTIISDGDQMYADDNYQHYYSVTKSAINIIEDATKRFSKNITNILDMPSGHGRVCRGLRWLFPQQNIVACDINRKGVDFCGEQYNCHKIYSVEDIDKLTFPDKFDLIWCGSLLTHFNESQGFELLKLFINNLSDEGILIITSQGTKAVKNIIDGVSYGLEKNQLFDLINDYYMYGYSYADYKYDPGYGISLIKPTWLEKSLGKLGGKLLDYQEASWDNHQDVAIISKASHTAEK